MIKNDQGALFCSQQCISKTYPVCRGCQKRSQGGIVINGENDKFFCDGCAKKPRCFCCDLPADCSSLGDGRPICPECAKTSVKSDDEFLSLVKEVRGRMDKDLGLSTPHDIKYRMVDLPTLEKITPGQSSRMELGAFKEEETVETTIRRSSSLAFWKEAKEEREEKRSTNYKLFVLSEMSRAKMIEVAAHELAHDWMSCHYPDIENPAIVEGWAEFVAWRVNKLYGNGNLNPRIENNLDETYGGGFRTFRKAFVSGGDSAVMELLGKSPAKNR